MYIIYLPIWSREKIAKNTTEICFAYTPGEFSFRAGQYVRITIPQLAAADPRENYRDFSIASSPNARGQFKIAIRNSESGFKKSLLEQPLDTRVKITGPFGNLAFPENAKDRVIFVAGGIGITPFFSMITYSLEQKNRRHMTLFFGNKSEEDAPYLKELEALAQKNANFTLRKKFGPIDKEFIIATTSDPKDALWFVAGPPAMVVAVKNILSDIGVSPERIHTEEFLGYEAGESAYGLSATAIEKEKPPETLFAKTLMQSFNEIALVSIADLAGTILYVNDMFVKISKYSRDELIGQNHRILRSGYHPQSYYNSLWEAISNGRIWRGEMKNLAKDSSYYWVDATVVPIINQKGKIVNYIAVRLNITERKEVEMALKKRTEDLEETNKLMVGRELKMIELKKEIENLKKLAKNSSDKR